MDFDPNEFLQKNKPASLIISEQKAKISDSELEAINKKAYLDATYQFLKTAYMREHVRVFAEEGKLPLIPKDVKLLAMLNNQADAICQKPPNMLITINPRKDVSLEELQKVVSKVVSKKTITHYAYVYEVRKEDEGLHCHILLKYADKPYNFKRGIKNTCKNICLADNPEILNFKFVTEDLIQQKFEYIEGHKKDSKMAGVNFTKQYRIQHNIESMYESNPPFPCRVALKPIEYSAEEEETLPPTPVGGE